MRRLGNLIGALALALLSISSAAAQIAVPSGDAPSGVALPDPLTPEAVREVVSQMSDADVRALLLERLDAVAAANAAQSEAESGGLVAFAENATLGVIESLGVTVSLLPTLYEQQMLSFSNFWETLTPRGVFFMFVVMALAIAVGLAAEFLFRRLTQNWRERAEIGGERTLRQTIVFLVKRFCTDIAGLIIFYQVATFVGPIIGWNLAPALLGDPAVFAAIGPYVAGIWWWLIIVPRIGAAVNRLTLAPNRPEHRLVNTDDATAAFLMRHTYGVMFLFGFTYWIIRFNELNGVPMGTTRLGFWLNISLHAYIIWVTWKAREGLSMMMRVGDELTPMEERAAWLYPRFIIAATVATWWLIQIFVVYEMWSVIAGAPHIQTIALLSFAPAMDMVVRGLVKHLTPPMRGEGLVAEKAYFAAKRSYVRIGRVVVFVAVIWAVGRIWGLDFANLAEAGVGAQFAGRFIEILIVLAFGYLIWELVSLWINRKLAAEQTAAGFDLSEDEPGGGEGGGAGGSRLSTVLPLLLGVMKVAIAVIFGLIALGNIGIDITPLLAGAGIVGLAVGFGAQKLVADVVSGIFFLVDDAFRTGEYVEVEGTVGTVEKISIRSMQLRHHKGPVHTIPYGEIPKITNYSRDWVIMKLKFTVPFDTDPNKVKKMFKTIGKEMMEIPEFAQDLLQPFKSQGVFDFDDVGMIIRGKFMAKPGKQFTLRKEIYNRVKKAFEDNDIDFARREVRVAFPGLDNGEKLTEEDKAAIAAAASQAAQEQAQETPPKG